MFGINIKGELRSFNTPWVLGIVNVTPDSFYDGSRTPEHVSVRERIARIRMEGAQGVDIGGYSSRPGAADVSAEEEYRRVSVALECVSAEWPDAIVSVDTFRSEVARRCVEEWGIDIVNDISGGDMDADMFETVAQTGVAYILMHMRGTPVTMQSMCNYSDVTADVMTDLAFKASRLQQLGVKDIILDPGFGFAKTVEQNYELMAHLRELKTMGYPLLVGVSRKSMIYKPLGLTPAESLPGTTALNTFALLNGADILRVHDVAEAVQVVKVVGMLDNSVSQ